MTLTCEQAQCRTDQIHAFRAELKELSRDNILCLTNEQQRTLEQHHQRLLKDFQQRFNTDNTQHAKQLSLAMRITSLIGTLAMVASVWFLFYQFWDDLTPWVQQTVGLGAALGSLLITVTLKSRDADGYFTKMAATLALACLVLNTWILGQIYNLAPSPEAYLMWGIYGLALAYYTHASLLLFAALALLGTYCSFCLARISGFTWPQAWELPELWLIAGALIFAGALRQTSMRFASIYRLLGAGVVLASLGLLSFWGDSSLLALSNELIENLYFVFALIASGVGLYFGIGRNWPEVRQAASASLILLLLSKAVDWFWDQVPHSVFFLLISLLAIITLLGLKRLRERGARHAH